MNSMFNGMFGKIGADMCKLSMSGKIAVKTSGGYKAYDVKTGRLTNCDSFVMDFGEDMFFCIPTNKVEIGDIILVSGKPKCVINVDKNSIRVLDYENSSIIDIVPERHIFMGESYFYGKIMSMFGSNFFGKGKKGVNQYFKYKLMMDMFKGNGSNNNMLPLMMMGGIGDLGNMFDNMFDFDENDNEDVENDKEE